MKFPVFSTPVVVCVSELVVVVVINVKGKVVIFDYGNNGTVLWEHSVNANVFSSPILLPNVHGMSSNRVIVFGAEDKHLHSISISPGKDIKTIVHKTKHSKLEGKSRGMQRTLINCIELWKVKHSERIYATPYAFVGDINCSCQTCRPCPKTDSSNLKTVNNVKKPLLIGSVSTDGVLNIICVNSGLVISQYKLGNNIFSSPIIVQNHVVIGNRDNFLTCFKLEMI